MQLGKDIRSKITCWACKKPISGARTVIAGQWHCGDCTYKHDHPDAEIAESKRQRALKIQDETLFPLPKKKARH